MKNNKLRNKIFLFSERKASYILPRNHRYINDQMYVYKGNWVKKMLLVVKNLNFIHNSKLPNC